MFGAFDPTPWLGAAGGLLGLAGILGAAFAVLKANVSSRTIELWQEQAAALEERLQEEKDVRTEAEAQRGKDIERIAAAEKHTAECEKRLTALERVVGDTMRKARTTRRKPAT